MDEIGADVYSRNRSGETTIFEARAVDVMSFLLERGTDPTVQENDGWTALMYHSNELRVDFVKRLLQDPRVVADIDVLAATNKDQNSRFRVAALHLVCRREARYTSRIARVIELLLLAGANPFLRTRPTQDGLHHLRLNNSLNHLGVQHAILSTTSSTPATSSRLCLNAPWPSLNAFISWPRPGT